MSIYVLTNEQLDANKTRFTEIVNSIKWEGFKKEALLDKLNRSDFFLAPASTRYHCDFVGGLCLHSLNVYDNLIRLMKEWYPDKEIKTITGKNEDGTDIVEVSYERTCPYDEDILKIAGLCHDLSKMNFYEISYRNEKNYNPKGTKRDGGGTYDWVSVEYYTVLPDDKILKYGGHEANAAYILRHFFTDPNNNKIYPKELEVAILHHHGGVGDGTAVLPTTTAMLSSCMSEYPLLVFLHVADMIATFYTEKQQ